MDEAQGGLGGAETISLGEARLGTRVAVVGRDPARALILNGEVGSAPDPPVARRTSEGLAHAAGLHCG